MPEISPEFYARTYESALRMLHRGESPMTIVAHIERRLTQALTPARPA